MALAKANGQQRKKLNKKENCHTFKCDSFLVC